MYERYQLYKTRLVDITEENNSTYLRILDDNEKYHIFQIKEMLLMDCLNEMDDAWKEQQSIIYRGKVRIREQDAISDQTYFFKYIPLKEEWYICGDIKRLLVVEDN